MQTFEKWPWRALSETISFLGVDAYVPRTYRADMKKLRRLCIELKEIRSMATFERRLTEVVVLCKRILWLIGADEDKWVIIRGLLAECFLTQVVETKAVAKMLRLMTAQFPTSLIEDLLVKQILLVNIGLSPSVMEARRRSGLRTLNFAAYLLYHVNKGRVKFRGRRLTEMINICDFQYSDVIKDKDVVLMLLQHGVRLSEKEGTAHCVVSRILSQLISTGVFFNQWDRASLHFRVEPSELTTQVKDLLESFRVVLRRATNPQLATFLLAGRRNLQLAVLLPFYDKLFPNCHYGRFSPPPLLHMCRCKIREILYDNWNLPQGIAALPVPELVKEYLNLERDL